MPAQVLEVEDDAFTCELIREILCSAGMPSLERNSVEGALRMARIYLAASLLTRGVVRLVTLSIVTE